MEYIGNRVVPKHGGVWSSGKAYEPLTIVYEEGSGDSYISRKDVPAGTLLTQEDYWALCSRYSEQMELYQKSVDAERRHGNGIPRRGAAVSGQVRDGV